MRYYVKLDKDNKPIGWLSCEYENQTLTELSEMEYYRLRYQNGIDDTSLFEQMQNEKMIELIREAYSVNDEFKILREHQCGIPNSQFDKYNAYVLDCKAKSDEVVQAFVSEVKQISQEV